MPAQQNDRLGYARFDVQRFDPATDFAPVQQHPTLGNGYISGSASTQAGILRFSTLQQLVSIGTPALFLLRFRVSTTDAGPFELTDNWQRLDANGQVIDGAPFAKGKEGEFTSELWPEETLVFSSLSYENLALLLLAQPIDGGEEAASITTSLTQIRVNQENNTALIDAINVNTNAFVTAFNDNTATLVNTLTTAVIQTKIIP